jgi:hypothetical protein
MALKYQSEIDKFQLTINCPENVSPPAKEIEAFRFSFSPITHDLNFLPNVVFDRVKPIPFNYAKASAIVKCRRCGASFYINLESALNQWSNLSEQVRDSLGYTHIAAGKLDAQDGLMKEPEKSGHFGFYENDTADLTAKFNLLARL